MVFATPIGHTRNRVDESRPHLDQYQGVASLPSLFIPPQVCSAASVHALRLFGIVVVVLCAAAAGHAFDDEFKPSGVTWDVDGGPIVYVMDPAGSDDIDDGSDLQAVRDAFRVWACAPRTKLRFEEGEGPGPRVMDLSDGKNTVFWDETGTDCFMGPATLGIASLPTEGTNTASDICFNGFHHTWGVGRDVDIQSIAMHEIGHFIGLNHPCDNDDDQSSCLSVSDAIMFPQWSGSPDRELRRSELAAVASLYPLGEGDTSGCDGPFRPGERCGCNDECVEGFVCAPDVEGTLRCSTTCSGSNRDCGDGSTCILDVPQDGQEAIGLCVRASNELPGGAICSSNTQCASRLCAAVIDLGASICQVSCDNDDDCAGGTCSDGLCLGGFESEECPVDDEEPDCACTSSNATSSAPFGVVVSVALMGLLRRRRMHRGGAS
jgi:MYXO-CTERM domain-containing protein